MTEKFWRQLRSRGELSPGSGKSPQALVEPRQLLGLDLQHLHSSPRRGAQLCGLVGQMAHVGSVDRDLGLQQVLPLQQLHNLCQLLPTGRGAGQHLARDEWSLQSRVLGPHDLPAVLPKGCWSRAHLQLLELAGGGLHLPQQAQHSLRAGCPLPLSLEVLKEPLPAPGDLQLPEGHENRGGPHWAGVGKLPWAAQLVGGLAALGDPALRGPGLVSIPAPAVGQRVPASLTRAEKPGGAWEVQASCPPAPGPQAFRPVSISGDTNSVLPDAGLRR